MCSALSVRASRPDSDRSSIVMYPTSSTYERNLDASAGRTFCVTFSATSLPSRSFALLSSAILSDGDSWLTRSCDSLSQSISSGCSLRGVDGGGGDDDDDDDKGAKNFCPCCSLPFGGVPGGLPIGLVVDVATEVDAPFEHCWLTAVASCWSFGRLPQSIVSSAKPRARPASSLAAGDPLAVCSLTPPPTPFTRGSAVLGQLSPSCSLATTTTGTVAGAAAASFDDNASSSRVDVLADEASLSSAGSFGARSAPATVLPPVGGGSTVASCWCCRCCSKLPTFSAVPAQLFTVGGCAVAHTRQLPWLLSAGEGVEGSGGGTVSSAGSGCCSSPAGSSSATGSISSGTTVWVMDAIEVSVAVALASNDDWEVYFGEVAWIWASGGLALPLPLNTSAGGGPVGGVCSPSRSFAASEEDVEVVEVEVLKLNSDLRLLAVEMIGAEWGFDLIPL
uniref:Uncharacterized protein n=1 Tax=Anopheles melas TaxID=34690 RepID=A0A182UCJ8_9DIPT